MYDVTLYYADERTQHIRDILSTRTKDPTQKELEEMANYILFGKDRDGLSIVDKKDAEIETKSGDFKRKKPVSLEETLESPTANEQTMQPIEKKSIYKRIKPSIDREKDADVPGLPELWVAIDRMQYVLDVNMGKIDIDPSQPKVPFLDSLQTYRWRHMLIDVRRQQFYLKDSAKPQIGQNASPFGDPLLSPFIQWDDEESPYAVAPLGIMYGNDPRFCRPWDCHKAKDYVIPENKKYVLDFCNPVHVYHLLDNYSSLLAWCYDEPQAPLRYLIDTLDWYIEKANLNEVRKHILVRKIDKASNSTIQEELYDLYGKTYNNNYISTIWKKEICEKIAKAAELHKKEFDARNSEKQWRICPECKKIKLLTPENFFRRAKSPTGYANYCKKCRR